MTTAGTPTQGQPVSSDSSHWLEFYQQSKAETVKQLADAGKLIQGTAAAILTAYLAILAALDIIADIGFRQPVELLIVPIFALWGSIAFAILSVVPFPDEVNPSSPTDIKAAYTRITRIRSVCIQVAAALLMAGTFSAILIFFK
jgi:hypothetical protein